MSTEASQAVALLVAGAGKVSAGDLGLREG